MVSEHSELAQVCGELLGPWMKGRRHGVYIRRDGATGGAASTVDVMDRAGTVSSARWHFGGSTWSVCRPLVARHAGEYGVTRQSAITQFTIKSLTLSYITIICTTQLTTIITIHRFLVASYEGIKPLKVLTQ